MNNDILVIYLAIYSDHSIDNFFFFFFFNDLYPHEGLGG